MGRGGVPAPHRSRLNSRPIGVVLLEFILSEQAEILSAEAALAPRADMSAFSAATRSPP